MSIIRKTTPTLIAIIALIGAFSSFSFAKSHDSRFPNISIDNFGQMDERFYRGSRPNPEDLKALAALGINTVIDLTDNSMQKEKPAVEAAGMRYINIPIVDKAYPSVEQANAFLKTVNDPATGKFYVHCAGGRHRTGIMGAVYRFNHDHWNFDQAYKEMEAYDFYTRWGHGALKDYVKDYYGQVQAIQTSTGQSAGTISR